MTDETAPTTLDGDDAPAASYAAATAEIDRILDELERDDLDIDLLATKVRRAAVLLSWCRERIRSTTDDVRQAVEALGAVGDAENTD
ncbi:MAG: exodeoxyribonuclease VII small subunit [Actinobacteria bacterium]|nr:exodeoxyribonuclease VII small subunit [Actinomycetota bacterium]